ncbi:hypothetical protein RYX36_005635 [Vicia faba]
MASVGHGNGLINGVVSNKHTATISEVDEFCNALGGNRPIHSILIANNGMAAVKFIRSVRSWAYETFGTEKAILLVAMATPEDMRINAEHIRIADQFVEVPGGTNNNNYANVQLILEVCDVDFMRLMDKLVYPNPAAYRDQLIRFSQLNHIIYSELALKASQLLEQTKLSELRSSIARSLSELEMFTEDGENIDTPKRKGAINDRMEDLVSAPLAVEDALVGLFDHSDNTLQRRVVETYIRRLYQPYLVKSSIRMQWHRSGLIATWEFLEEYVERKNGVEDKTLVEKHSEKKWGVMVVIKSLQFLPAIISAALREATNNFHDALKSGSVDSNKHGNMMHIGLVGINNQMSLLQDSGDEDQAQERINKLAKILREQEVGSIIHAAGVGDISCIIQRDEGRAPMRHSFHWSAEKLYYEEEPLLRHLEPPLSIYLELDKLKGYENIRYTPSRDRQWHLYTVVDTKPQPIQRMFLRTLLRQPTTNEGYSAYQRVDAETSRTQLDMSFTSRSIFRSLMGAMEELELNSHNTTIKSEHAHMYLYVLREQHVDDLVHYSKKINIDAGQEETTVETILEELAQEIHSSVGVRMHRLGVFVWEVKLWITACGQANGAWRVIVNNVTGHTSTVHAFQTSLEQSWSIQQTEVQRAKDKDLLKVTELKFSEKEGSWGTSLVPAECPPGLNDVGMVAWLMEMCTPEFPSGRTILVVSNDVTFKAGSFGPREDAFFRAQTPSCLN